MKKVIVIATECTIELEIKLNKIYQQYKVKKIKYNTTKICIGRLLHTCILVVKEKI